MTAIDVINIVLGVAGLTASIFAYLQSERAATSANQADARSQQAAANSLVAAQRADAAVIAVREEAKIRNFASHLLVALQLVREVETLLAYSLIAVAQIRMRDLVQQLTYVNARFDSVVAPTTLAGLVEAKAQIEQIASKLRNVQTIGKTEDNRISGIVHRVVEILTTEHAKVEKRD